MKKVIIVTISFLMIATFFGCTNEPEIDFPGFFPDDPLPDDPLPDDPLPDDPLPDDPLPDDPLPDDPEPETKLTIVNGSFEDAFVWANRSLFWDWPGSYVFGKKRLSHEYLEIDGYGLGWILLDTDTLNVNPNSYYIYILWVDDPTLYRTITRKVTVAEGEHEVFTFRSYTILVEVSW